MDIKRIEHIGIAVKSIEEARGYYENILGLKMYKVEEVADQKVKTAFFMVGETKIELLEPTSEDSPVAKFMEKNGGKGGIHHIAYAVSEVNAALNEVEGKGTQLIDKTGRKGADGLQIGFIHPKATGGVLTEFCSNPNA